MGLISKLVQREMDKALQEWLGNEAQENAKYLRQLLAEEKASAERFRADSLFWRQKALALMEQKSKGGK